MKHEEVKNITNEMLPIQKLIPLGLQHVLAMYAGAVAVPLIVGAAVKLSPEQIAVLVALDLFACGVATLIQAIGIGNFAGIKLPVILGCSFAAVSPMIVIGTTEGMRTAFGAIILSGIIIVIIAPLYGKILRFFPPVVTGTTLTMIGLSLIPVGINNMGGGYVEDFGNPKYLALAFFTILIVIICNRYFKGFIQSLSVLIGLVVGTLAAIPMGMVNMKIVYEAAWFELPKLFYLGTPQFSLGSTGLMLIVMLIVLVESTGSFIGIGQICGMELGEKDLVKGFRAEGLATLVGGIFNSFPYTTFAQNIGLVSMTKVYSRWVIVTAGVILMILGLCPKFAALATIIPAPVFGGATSVMFATVAISGFQSLSNVDYSKTSNMLTTAVSLAFGIGITVKPEILSQMPSMVQTIFHSAITTTAVFAIVLNAVLNWGDKSAQGDISSVGNPPETALKHL
ncbi:nucleobase:cation symporter-2 family protein [Romboutsia sp.]|uniref:nucleobase:cation symporter-2 family protein n=1 Tax=Romboutsia sp. TaxID=1965302 RepID=UPI003F305CD8